jgi:hypothetical protein
VDRLCERRIGGASGGSRCEWQIWGASGGSGVRVADLGYERWIGCASGRSGVQAADRVCKRRIEGNGASFATP